MKVDEIDVIDAIYNLDGSMEAWLRRLANCVGMHLHADLGCAAILWRPGWDGTYERTPFLFDVPPGLDARVDVVNAPLMTPEMLQLISDKPLSSMTETFEPGHPFRQHYRRHLSELGIVDTIKFSAFDTPAHLLLINPFHSYETSTSPGRRAQYAQLSAHLSAMMRLRRRLARNGKESADGFFNPDGRDLDAFGEAQSDDNLAQLRAAVQAREKARTSRVRRDPEQALGLMTGLVMGRWSLVDRFDADGRRFVVALRNDTVAKDPRALTPREEQVAQHVGLGRSNRETAYALGISVETIVTHLRRALRKLRCDDRSDLVRLMRRGQYELGLTGEDDEVAFLVEEQRPRSSPHLTPAEGEVLEGIRQGMSNAQIAKMRGCSIKTVANQVGSILAKTNAPSRYALMASSDEPALPPPP